VIRTTREMFIYTSIYTSFWDLASHTVFFMQEAVHGRMLQLQIEAHHYLC